MLMLGPLAGPTMAAVGTKADAADARRSDKIGSFNLSPYSEEYRGALSEIGTPTGSSSRRVRPSRSVGSATTRYEGIGRGVSIDQTWCDFHGLYGQPRQVVHWWDGETGTSAEVSVHFIYIDAEDSLLEGASMFEFPMKTGYNVYDATTASNNWPRGQDQGCDLEAADSLGWVGTTGMDMMENGRVVIGSWGHFFRSFADGQRRWECNFLYQGAEFSCTYDPRSHLNVTWIDTNVYRANFLDQSEGNYSLYPHLATQWDGANTIVHAVLGEWNETYLSGDGYCYPNCSGYRSYTHYRKVGDRAELGSWSTGQILDSIRFPWISLAAAPYPHTGVAIVYVNPSHYGALLNNNIDRDVWCRESFDRGLSWQTAYSITNYMSAIADHPDHFTAYLESGCIFDTEGDLHAYWPARPTSANPYTEGWSDWVNANLYHWEKNNDQSVPGTGHIVKVANGNFVNSDALTGEMWPLACGLGLSFAGYLGWITMGQCDDKLYLIWSQIHARANRFPWRDAAIQPAPGVLDDCSYTGNFWAMANWEILMSVAKLETSSLWDYPRNISGTYTPDCGIVGDPLAAGPCGSEWKPSVEKYALNETGLTLYWPEDAIVDMTPDGEPAYEGGWYLNMVYIDDQFPGKAGLAYESNPPFTLNSVKWIRLACVEPVEVPQIDVSPESVEWPEWVELGQISNVTVTVVNEGNITLNVTEIGHNDGGGAWLSVSENPTPAIPFEVAAGVDNTATFDIIIDASGFSTTAWLDGEVWLKSDAANSDSIGIDILVLAASEVEPMIWDTVMTHENMFDDYFDPEGECVALAVGNAGDLGWGAGTSGSINLDYAESGRECGERIRDAIYLYGATPFAILADDASGTNAELTQSCYDADQADETGWDPIGDKGSITGGLATGGDYDSVYTGKFVNRDTSIAFERIVYGPRSETPESDIINFVVVYTRVYSGDGQAHAHVTIGNVCDWDVPAERVPENTSGLSSAGFVYVQGTDTLGVASCLSHTGRFATEVFGGGYTTDEWAADNCVNSDDHHSVNALIMNILADTTHYRDGTPLVPSQPNPLVWWEETGVPGMNADATIQDQAVWFTYRYDFSLGADDTLHYWTVLTTVRDGTLSDLEAQVSYAKCWYLETIRGCDCGCCVGRVGDANGQSGDEPTISDISVMIDAKFITGTCGGDPPKIACLAEADTNHSGGADPTCDDITISDISILIDYLFITGPETATLMECL